MARQNKKMVSIPLETLKALLQGADIALEKGAGRLHNILMDATIVAEKIIKDSEA